MHPYIHTYIHTSVFVHAPIPPYYPSIHRRMCVWMDGWMDVRLHQEAFLHMRVNALFFRSLVGRHDKDFKAEREEGSVMGD